MKRMKRLATLLLTLCLIVPCVTFVSHAANGQIMFTDPTAKTGENVTVTGVVKTGGPDIGDANVTMTYDNTALQFVSGDNVTAGTDGSLVYDGKSSGGSTEHRFNIVFKVLKEGTTKVDVSSYKAYLASNETLNCDKGSATVTAEKGTDPVAPTEDDNVPGTTGTAGSGEKVTVNDKEYQLVPDFQDKDIPAGFTPANITYNGAQYKAAKQESSGVILAYLTDSANTGSFFVYNEDDATFSSFEQVMISDTTTIILLSSTKGLKIPSTYKSVTFSIKDSGNEFPAWQNAKTDGFYIVYGINNDGKKGFYQYDKNEGTYQRFDMPTVSVSKKSTSMLSKVEDFVNSHLKVFIIGAAIGILLLIVILIVIAVKLHNRNAELDELYDEFGIDEEEESKAPLVVRAREEEPVQEKKSVFASKKDQADESFFNDDEYDDDYDDSDDDDFVSHDTSKSLYDDDDDDFKVDFIDLDD